MCWAFSSLAAAAEGHAALRRMRCRSEVRATSGKGFVRLMAEHEWLHLYYNYQVGPGCSKAGLVVQGVCTQCGPGSAKRPLGRPVGGSAELGRWQVRMRWDSNPSRFLVS